MRGGVLITGRRRRWSGRIVFAFMGCAVIVLVYVSFHLMRKISLTERSRHHSSVSLGPSSGYEKVQSPVKNKNAKRLETPVPSFVTVVMPSVVKPQERKERLKAITETWGPNSHSLYVVHDLDEFQSSVVEAGRKQQQQNDSFYPKPLVVPSHIPEDMGFDRLQFVLTTVLHHESNPSYAFFVNDHTFVIPEHLCLFLSKTQQTQERQQQGEHRAASGSGGGYHLYAGHAMIDGDSEYMFNSGASGYILSRKTMQALVDIWSLPSDSHVQASSMSKLSDSCLPPKGNHNAKWFQGNPGLIIAKCLHYAFHVDAIDTRDIPAAGNLGSSNNIGDTIPEHVFHAFGLVREVTGKVDQWYRNKHRRLPFAKRDPGTTDEDIINELLPSGTHCCSTHTISFHYVYQAEARALHHLRNWIREEASSGKGKGDILTSQLEKELYRLWPNTFQTLGGYSRGLPNPNDDRGTMEDILKVLEKISGPSIPEFESCWNLDSSI